MKRTRVSEAPSKAGNPNWFTGKVWSSELAVSSAAPPVHVALVTFEPGARTAWHTHPFGQVLIGASGVGRVQVAGEPARTLHPGDTVVFAPGERHWHGAGPDQLFSHLSVQGARPDGTMADWYEQVTEDEYGQPAQP